MFLDLIPVLNAFIILGSMLVIGRNLSKYFKNEQEYNRVRDDQIVEMIAEINVVLSSIIDQQKALDIKMNALAVFVDKHSTNVTSQQEQFDSLARADMLSARREELLRTKELKVALERLMGVALTSRQPPATNDVLALENLTKRIKELEAILN